LKHFGGEKVIREGNRNSVTWSSLLISRRSRLHLPLWWLFCSWGIHSDIDSRPRRHFKITTEMGVAHRLFLLFLNVIERYQMMSRSSCISCIISFGLTILQFQPLIILMITQESDLILVNNSRTLHHRSCYGCIETTWWSIECVNHWLIWKREFSVSSWMSNHSCDDT
jgi:hypothetical protein